MFKSTANAQQMLTRTANHSTKGSAKGFVDGVGVNPVLVLGESERKEARRRALNAQIDRLSMELIEQKQVSNTLLHRKDMPGHLESIAKANALRASIKNLRDEITAMGARARRPPSDHVDRAFIDICKETMTKAQFDLVMRQAKARVHAAANNEQDESK